MNEFEDFDKVIESAGRQARRVVTRVVIAVLAFWAFVIAGIIFAAIKIFG